jgi:hypothetical protein
MMDKTRKITKTIILNRNQVKKLHSILIIGLLFSFSSYGQSVDNGQLLSSNSYNISISFATREEFKKAKNHYKDQLLEDTLVFMKKNGVITLPLRLTEIPSVIFTDSLVDGDEAHREFDYLGQYPNLDMYLVSGSFWEHYECYLIDKKTGMITVVWTQPQVSPSSEYLANLSMPYGLEGVPNGLQIWKYNQNEKKLTNWLEIDQQVWAPVDFVWENQKSILLKVYSVEKLRESYRELHEKEYYYLRFLIK